MANKVAQLVLVDLAQSESLDHALARIVVTKPFDNLAEQVMLLHQSTRRVGVAVRVLRQCGQPWPGAARGDRA